MTDSERRAQAQRLVETYSDMILRLSYTYLHNTKDAEDICQETLIKLLYQSRRFSSPEHEKAWVIRTAANACKDILKRPDRSRTCALEACADQAAPASEDGDVLDAVQSLPQEYREVIYLHYYEGYTLKEIGALLSIPPATAGTRLARGRERLKTILGEDIHENCV